MKLPGGGTLSVKELFRRIYAEYQKDAVSDTAAQLSYYFVYALFPALFFLVTLTAYLPLRQPLDQMLDRLRPIVPAAAMGLIDEHLRALISQPRPRLLTFALLVSIWSASRGVDAVRRALNLAYDVKESRPFWKTDLISIAMTLAGAMMVLASVAVLVAGGGVGFWIAGKIGVQSEFLFVMRWLRWPTTAVMVMTAAALTYYFLPDVKQTFKFITPGSVVASLAWMGATWGFGVYVSAFGSYNVTYGSVGGVIVLLTWLYISGFIFIMGGELNAVLEHASVSGKAEGARAEGQRPAPPQQRPSAMPPAAAKNADVAAEVAAKT
jgi:membrane protein